jgi:phage terminase Nu1 subunit (DNA packaging protein)
MLVRKADIAKILNISPSAVHNLIQKEGMPGRVGSGPTTKYDLTEVVPWYVARMQIMATKNLPASTSAGHFDKDAEDAELTYWKKEKEKTRTLKEQGQLVPVEDAVREMNHRLTQIRNVLDTIPATWAPYVIGLNTLEETSRVLNEQLDNMYTTLSGLPDSADEEDELEGVAVETAVSDDEDDNDED